MDFVIFYLGVYREWANAQSIPQRKKNKKRPKAEEKQMPGCWNGIQVSLKN